MDQQQVKLFPPLKGIFFNLEQVPDPVFAQKMVGDGFAIDPLENILYAPLDGTIKSIHRAKHALTIAADEGEFDVLLHIGLETVALGGHGFELKVDEGQHVRRGDILVVFDLAYLSEHARALISPILVTDIDENELSIEILVHSAITDLSQPILLINCKSNLSVPLATSAVTTNCDKELEITESELITISSRLGIHARPAAVLTAQARKYSAEILLYRGQQSANLKSVVSLLSLAIIEGDVVKIIVKGDGGAVIIQEIKRLLLDTYDAETSHSVTTPSTVKAGKAAAGKYYGVVASTGIAVAKLAYQALATFQYADTASDATHELAQLHAVLSAIVDELTHEIAALSPSEIAYKDILSAHRVILSDPELLCQATTMIHGGSSAAYAWNKSIENACQILLATANQLLIERQSDLRDVRDRVLGNLCGEKNMLMADYTEDVILVADEFTPSQIIRLSSKVKGLASVRGGVTSHVAILARTRAIPLLIGLDEAVLDKTSVDGLIVAEATAKLVVLDSICGNLNVTPTELELATAESQVKGLARNLQLALDSASLPALTRDGVQIHCLANIGNLDEAEIGLANGGEGIGLLRTEFMFIEASEAPSEEQQFQQYSAINNKLQGKPFIIRTLDAGGDKHIPYLKQAYEANPMLGVRGVRLCLAHREILTTQLRSIIRMQASNIKIMLPMISTLSEYRMVKQIFEEPKIELGVTTKIELGIMVEVPSVALMSEAFTREVDFMSIGSNDLTQYVLAVDREHSQLGHGVDHLHPAILAAIALIVRGAKAQAISLSVCGLMASEKLAIPLLIGLGITNLSMTVTSIAENKAFIRSLDFSDCQGFAADCLKLTTAQEVREYLNAAI